MPQVILRGHQGLLNTMIGRINTSWHRAYNNKCHCSFTFNDVYCKRVQPLSRLRLEQSKRYASSSRQYKSLPFSISRDSATAAFKSFHKSPLTSTPTLTSVDQKYLPFYLFSAKAKTQYRASIGRSMSIPYRDPQTGRIHQRQRTVWTTLPEIHEIEIDYSSSDKESQIYAGLQQYEELISPFLPIHIQSLKAHAGVPKSQEEEFQMTQGFAESKLKERIVEHTSQLAREMLMQEHGSMVKINEISVQLELNDTVMAYYPTYVVNTTALSVGRQMKYLVSGVTGRVTGLKFYDPTLTGAATGTLTSALFYALFSSPVFSFLMFGLGYFVANTISKWLPIWRTMRWEGRRAADVVANTSYGGASEPDPTRGFAGFGDFNPFGAFMGGSGSGPRAGAGDPFSSFDPFAGAGSFNGQRRSSDPFYGTGGTRSNQQQQRQRQQQQQQSPPQRATSDLYAVLGVSRSASQDEITAAFRKLALSKHPDKVSDDKKAEASHEFAKINEAYRVLRSAGKRAQYDRYGVI